MILLTPQIPAGAPGGNRQLQHHQQIHQSEHLGFLHQAYQQGEGACHKEEVDPPHIHASGVSSVVEHTAVSGEHMPQIQHQGDDLLLHVAPGNAFGAEGGNAADGVEDAENQQHHHRGEQPAYPFIVHRYNPRILKDSAHCTSLRKGAFRLLHRHLILLYRLSL